VSQYRRLLLLIIALVIGAAVVVSKIPMRRGLDLAGGIRVVLQAEKLVDEEGKPLSASAKADKMAAVERVITNRIKGIGGVAEPRVQRQSSDRIVVEMPGIEDREKALAELQSTAQLEFYWLKYVESRRNRSAPWEMLQAEPQPDGTEIFAFRNKENEIIKGDTPEHQKEILLKVVNAYDPVLNPKGEKPLMTGNDLKPESKGDLGQGSEPEIRFVLTPKGTGIFADFTRRHVDDIVAVFLGGRLITAPNIKEPITNGEGVITGFSTLEEATRKAEFLNAGALPVPLHVVQLDDVEATLGKETVNQAIMAGILGLGLVLLFMLGYYRLPGLLADVALSIYALLTFALYKALGVTMTLPGFAGFILSIGMAVDANILIFERLKEELKSGKTLRASIDAGFNRAFTAIFDSNVCTIITAIVLYKFATGMVQSFALTLGLGVVLSMFTAITVTRTFLHLLVTQEWAQKPSWFGLSTSWFHRWQPNIVARRNWFFALSAAVIVPGLVFYLVNFSQIGSGLRPGIEFQPGTTMQMSFSRKVTVTDVHRVVADQGVENEVQISKGKAGGATAFIRTRLVPGNTTRSSQEYTAKVDSIKGELGKAYGKLGNVQVSTVGPTVSKELTQNAIWAVLIAGIAIVIYLSSRFAIGGFLNGLKYGVCAIVATFHDVLVITGIFAITGYFLHWEIDTLFVTAVLTMIGFSTHDTIVVFDRIRENLRHRLRGEDYEGLTNRSILQTFARSINTSFTVVLTVAALLIFGGPIIRHFYVALIAGIVSGTYSSIFNATPLVVVWEGISARRKSGAARRRGFEDKPLVPTDRARDLRPIAQSAGPAPKDGDPEAEPQVGATPKPARVKVKPKKRKRRY